MTRDGLPEILELPWTRSMKPLESARTSLDVLDDGRLHMHIEHDVLRDVTPQMLDYWFRHIEGELTVEGVRCTRYRAWHPADHVGFRVARRLPEGGAGAGSVFHLHEVLGRDPRYELDIHTLVTRLDPGGFAHRPRVFAGLPAVRLDYAFTPVRGGTRYVNSLTVGLEGPLARPVNALVRARAFTEAQGHAWLLHNVEEVGNLERFLPALFEAHRSGRRVVRTVGGALLVVGGGPVGPG